MPKKISKKTSLQTKKDEQERLVDELYAEKLKEPFVSGQASGSRGKGGYFFALRLFLLSVVGLLTGAVGALLVLSGTLKLPGLEINNLLGFSDVTIERQENITITSEQRIADIAERNLPVILGIYDLAALSRGAGSFEVKGQAVALTTDGWLGTTSF